jgi:NitT/TauT family transport system substrate-binding protein
MKNPLIGPLLAAWACLALPGIGVAQEATVTVGMAPGIVTGAILMAEAHGYFKDVGIKVDLNNLDSSADAIALLAANRFQVVEGGVSAGYFNAFGKDLPIAMVASRVSTPGRHILMLRPDLKDVIKTPKDLKGRIIATNGPGSVSDYEIGKILEAYGLSLADVDLKIFPFPQYVIAFNNKAIDAGLLIPTWTSDLEKKGFAIPLAYADEIIKPSPETVAVTSINTDWAKKNPEVAKNFFVAYMRGVRDYCQAYHHGSTRKEMIDLMVRYGINRSPAFFEENPWPAREANGRINGASVMDMQNWFAKNKFTNKVFPAGQVIDNSYVDYASAKLGPFTLENKDSPLAGCR